MTDLHSLIQLSRPTYHAAWFRGQEATSDADARRLLLEQQIGRLSETGWLGGDAGVLSLHLLDWDLRKPEEARFNKDIPMQTFAPGVLAWYGILGLLISTDPERMRYTLTHHVFEQMPRRDAVEIRASAKRNRLFTVRTASLGQRQKATPPGAAQVDARPDTAAEQRLIRIDVGTSQLAEMLRPLADLRDDLQEIAAQRIAELEVPSAGWAGRLEDAQALLFDCGDVHSRLSGALRAAVDLFGELLELPLESRAFTRGVAPLLGHPKTNGSVGDADRESVRRFLASLALVTFLAPPDLGWHSIALIPGISCIENGRPLSSEGFFLVLGRPWPTRRWTRWLLLANLWAREKAVFDLQEKTRVTQQRRDVALASHILATPLRGVSALVHDLPVVVPQRAAIIREVTLMQALETFSTCLVNRSKAPPAQRAAPAAEFLAQVTGIVRGLCDILQNPEVSDSAAMAAHISGDAGLWDAVSSGLELPPRLEHSTVRFNWLQVYAVADGVIGNALKYNRPDSRACLRLRLHAEREGGREGVFLVVTSASALSSSEAVETVKALNACANIDWVGVSLIHLACEACGFRPPKWKRTVLEDEVDQVAFEAVVQVGTVEGESR